MTMTSRKEDGSEPTVSLKPDVQSQSERFIAKARELGLDEREETYDAALTKVAKHKLAADDGDKR